MKVFFVLASLLILHSAHCDDGIVADDVITCESVLGTDTCAKLRNLATLLHEKTSIVADAVKDAIAHHKTKAAEMLAYIKAYMSERLQCGQILNDDLCAKIFALGNRVKLTSEQIRLAITNAVASGSTKIQDIYQKAIDFMATEITCAKIFSEVSCNNIKLAIQKFHEQTQLLNEAIITAAQKHYNNVKDLLSAVKNTIVEKAVNFKCEDVFLDSVCKKLKDLGNSLQFNAQLVTKFIKDTIVNGATQAKDIYEKTLELFAEKLNCATIIGATACNNLVSIVTKLGEQTILINEAIVQALLKHTTNVKDIIIYVKNTIVEKATNFKCIDVLTQQQCDFLISLAKKFKLRADEVHRVIVETIVNGTNAAAQIYKVTIGQLIEDAKNIKCEDLISPMLCGALDSFAKNFKIKKDKVVLAVKMAIAAGAQTVSDIFKMAKEYIVETVSCDTFLGDTVCNVLESLANRLHVSFKKVISKLRELVASGINSVTELTTKITSYIWSLFWGYKSKRGVDGSISIPDIIMKMVENVITIGKDVKEKLKVEIQKAIEHGKVTLLKIKAFVKELIAKYGPQSDDVSNVHKSLIDQLKEALKKAHGKAKEAIEKLLTKSREQLQKLKDYIKSILGSSDESNDALDVTHDMFADMARQQLDEEFKMAEDEVENMVHTQLY